MTPEETEAKYPFVAQLREALELMPSPPNIADIENADLSDVACIVLIYVIGIEGKYRHLAESAKGLIEISKRVEEAKKAAFCESFGPRLEDGTS